MVWLWNMLELLIGNHLNVSSRKLQAAG